MKNKFMREAIRLSLTKMRGNHGGPFGAVVVRLLMHSIKIETDAPAEPAEEPQLVRS